MLPRVSDAASFRVALGEEAPYRDAVAAIARRHGLADDIRRFSDGANPVFAAGASHVVKLVAPPFRAQLEHERRVLTRLSGALSAPTPRVLDEGEIEGWPYLILDRLPGRTLRAAWDAIAPPARIELARALGALVAELHALPLDDPGDWPAFLEAQRRTCVARHAAVSTDARWLAQIPAFLAAVPLPAERRALLHTEIMREHVLVAGGPSGWRIGGLVDFGRAMVGAPEYELAAVGLFVAEGDAAVLRAFLLGWGLTPDALGPALRRRCLAYALLHRHGNLRWFLDRLPVPPGVSTLADLAEAWWCT